MTKLGSRVIGTDTRSVDRYALFAVFNVVVDVDVKHPHQRTKY